MSEVDGLREDIRSLRQEMRENHQAEKEAIAEVKDLAQATNGRVRTLELWRARVQGTTAAFSWVIPVGSAALGSVIGALVILLLTGGSHAG